MKHFLVLLLASFTLFSCSKEKSLETGSAVPGTPGGGNPGSGNPGTGNPGGGTGGGGNTGGSTYFIKAKIDGTEKTYTTDAGVFPTTAMGMASYSFSASNSAGEAVSLSLTFISGTLTAGSTYTEQANPTSYMVTGMLVNTASEGWMAGMNPSSADRLSITITSKTATEMAGTFKGAFYKMDASGSGVSTTEYKRFTEGQFKLPIR